MSTSFDAARERLVDHVFKTWGRIVCLASEKKVGEVVGIYKLNSREYQAGELTVGGTGPTIRLYNSDIDRFCIDRATKITVDGKQHTAVLPISDNGDGTSTIRLSEVKA